MTEDPGARWLRHMLAGEWEAAWQVSDALLPREVDWRAPRHLQRIWTGGAVEGRRVLVRCYHGLGDTIQFARFLPMLRARGAELKVWAQPALIPLLRTMPGAGRLLPLHDGAPEAEYDLDLEIMELAHLFRVTPATLPAEVPYLHPPRRAPAGGGLQVGLVWAAGDWDGRRSVPPALLAPLARIPGVTLHLLQRGSALAEWPAGLGVVSGTDDVLGAASLMAGLDLVVSVDSMPAHLAGALGRPVWTLLQAEADWRWMAGREDSPWYPTMRLFRQERAGDWAPVVARVERELRALARPCTDALRMA
jgi:hypothetical protein